MTIIRDMTCELARIAEREVRLDQARAIVKAAHDLDQVKLAAGYSPMSVAPDDAIVQQALKELLAAEAMATVLDADTPMTPGNEIVNLLLSEDCDDIDAKLVDCLTMEMQPELCALLVRRMRNGMT